MSCSKNETKERHMDLELTIAQVNKLFDELDFELSVLNLNLKVIADDLAVIEKKINDIKERVNDNE
jgi:uncharacterized coiled-coil protein SlyX